MPNIEQNVKKKVTIYYLNIQILTEIPLQYIYNQTHCFVDIKLFGVNNFKPFCLAGTSLAGWGKSSLSAIMSRLN